MHTSLRHHSITVEREAQASRARRLHATERRERRRERPSLRDRIHATLRPGRRVTAYA